MQAGELTITWLGDPVSLTVAGEIDVSTREQFRAALAELLGGVPGDAELNLGGVSFMDTHSVTLVVDAARRLHEEGARLIVHEPPDSLSRILTMLWGDGDGARLHIARRRDQP